MVGAHKIVWTLRHPLHLTTLRNTQPYRRNALLRTHFAHLFLLALIDLENLAIIPR